jgi:hypothetical protein
MIFLCGLLPMLQGARKASINVYKGLGTIAGLCKKLTEAQSFYSF